MTERPVSIVSGAASGIGRHMAGALHRAGHQLVLIDLNAEGLQKTAREHGFAGDAGVSLRPLDVRSAEGWVDVVSHAVERFGGVDNMLNIAGVLRPGYIHEAEADIVDLHLDVNAKGVMFATRAAARQMVKQGRGHVVNVASIAGLSHVPGLSAYCASKHAVRGFSLAVAHELRPHGVYVTVVCPDAVETPMLTLQERFPEAAMTFGARRPLSLAEVEAALFRALRDRPLEIVLDVPLSGRAVGAKLANAFPALARGALGAIVRRGRATQERRRGRA